MKNKKQSEKSHWELFWAQRERAEEVYSNADRIISQIQLTTPVTGKKILEVGAGTGRDGFKLVDAGAKVYLLDYADESLRLMKKMAAQNQIKVVLVKGNALALPFKRESFDIVFHQGLLEHFRDPKPLLYENSLTLKKGGLIVIDVPQRYHIYTVIKHVLILFNAWFAGWETEFSLRQLRRLVEHFGFTVKKVYGDWMHPSLCYRMLREFLKKTGIRVPMYPHGPRFLSVFRQKISQRLRQHNVLLNTCLDIGIIAQKLPVQE